MTAKITASADGSYGSLGVGANEAFRFGADNSGQLASFRNKLINGNFDFWQRGASFPASGYTADRWYSGIGAGASVVVNQSAIGDPVSGTLVPCLSWSRSVAGTDDSFLLQRVESVKTLAGRTATLSFKARASVDVNLSVYLAQVFGTGGSPSAPVIVPIQPVNLTTTEQTFKLQFAVPSISGKTLGINKDDFLQAVFLWPIASPNGSVFIRDVQLEEGSIATPFEQRPIGLELSLCQRYYHKSFTTANGSPPGPANAIQAPINPGAANGDQRTGVRFPVPMRAVPTVTTRNPTQAWGNTNFRSTSDSVDYTTSAGNIGSLGMFIQCNAIVPNTGAYGHYEASAEL